MIDMFVGAPLGTSLFSVIFPSLLNSHKLGTTLFNKQIKSSPNCNFLFELIIANLSLLFSEPTWLSDMDNSPQLPIWSLFSD
jgi:hypothetical protein